MDGISYAMMWHQRYKRIRKILLRQRKKGANIFQFYKCIQDRKTDTNILGMAEQFIYTAFQINSGGYFEIQTES